MAEIGKLIADQIWGIFTGIIISLIVYVIVTFLPIKENARYKAMFYRRKFSKLFWNPEVNISYHVKTQNLENKQLQPKELAKRISEKLPKDIFVFKGELGNARIFNAILGKTEIDITVTPSYSAKEQELIVDYLQCSFQLKKCKYRNFDGHLLDLIQVFRKLEASLEDVVGKWRGETLECEIKRLYEFTGILENLKMSSLKGKIGGQYDIELFEKKLVVYGTIETTMTAIIRDIVTYYY